MASATDPSHTKTFTTADDVRYGYIYYPAAPGKQTVLLLHGFCSSVYDWRHIIPRLAALQVGIIAPDLLGYGNTDAPDDPAAYRMRTMAEHVRAIVKHEGLEKVAGVGHDWGAGLLSHMWVFCPEIFSCLTFAALGYFPPGSLDLAAVNATAQERLGHEIFGYWEFFNSEESTQQLTEQFEAFQRIGVAADPDSLKYTIASTGALRKWLYQPKLPIDTYVSQEELDVHREIIIGGRGMRGPLNWYRAVMRGVNQTDYATMTKQQKTVTIPVLFIGTGKDCINVPEMMRDIMRPYVAQWEDVEIDAGHWVTLSHPEEVTAALAKFAAL